MADSVIESDVITLKEVGSPEQVFNVADDDSIINLTQRRRVAFIETLAPDGAAPENYKNNRIYLDALLHTSQTAQGRITAKNSASSSDKDRDIVMALAKQMRTVRGEEPRVIESVAIPAPSRARFAPNREVPSDLVDCGVSTETHSEFMKRTEDLDILPPDDRVPA